MTGTRGVGADRRRARGAHRGLKKILIEDMSSGREPARPWQDFSGAMVRQAVNEALNQLPPDHKEVVKLAYFGGLSNREIAEDMGLSVGGVQRRLRQALARISDYMEHGRATGRRAFAVLIAWLAARRLLHGFKVATVTVAVSVIAVQPVPSGVPGTPPSHAITTPHTSAVAESRQRDPAFAHNGPAQSVALSVPDPARVLAGLPVKLPPLHAPAVPQLPKLP